MAAWGSQKLLRIVTGWRWRHAREAGNVQGAAGQHERGLALLHEPSGGNQHSTATGWRLCADSKYPEVCQEPI